MTWKAATCEKCVFRVEYECRRFPPSTASTCTLANGFYSVLNHGVYSPACAEYQEEVSGKVNMDWASTLSGKQADGNVGSNPTVHQNPQG